MISREDVWVDAFFAYANVYVRLLMLMFVDVDDSSHQKLFKNKNNMT